MLFYLPALVQWYNEALCSGLTLGAQATGKYSYCPNMSDCNISVTFLNLSFLELCHISNPTPSSFRKLGCITPRGAEKLIYLKPAGKIKMSQARQFSAKET